MSTILPHDGTPFARLLRQAGDDTAFATTALGVPVAALLTVLAMPQPVVLPALSVLLVGAGVMLGLWTWATRQRSPVRAQRTYDLAAALMLIGFGAALLTDTTEALRCFGELEATLSCQASI